MSDPRESAGPTLADRLRALETRLAQLEAGLATGILGTDQTIKACHDRLDALLGAGKASPDGTLITNFNADKVDSIHAATTATANTLLALNASAKLPASITGDADTVDGYHAAGLIETKVQRYAASSSTQYTFNTKEYTDIATPQLSIDVQSGDIVIAWHMLTWWTNASQWTDVAAFRLSIGGNVSQALVGGADYTSLAKKSITLVFSAAATGTATWTVKSQVYCYSTTPTVYVRYQELVAIRIRGAA